MPRNEGTKSRAGGSRPPTKVSKLSHALSWALRHKAPEIGMTMTTAGWVPVQEFLESKHPRLKGITLEAIEEVVATSDKQRFAISYRPSSDFLGKTSSAEAVLCIRANQGHSIKTLDPNLLLRRLCPQELRNLSCVVHGTSVDAWISIEQEGLKTMNRTHIHFATGLPDNEQVISGMRRTATVYIYIDVEACIDDGIEFYLSENGVVLSEGTHGILGTRYFLKVTDSTGTMILTHGSSKVASNSN